MKKIMILAACLVAQFNCGQPDVVTVERQSTQDTIPAGGSGGIALPECEKDWDCPERGEFCVSGECKPQDFTGPGGAGGVSGWTVSQGLGNVVRGECSRVDDATVYLPDGINGRCDESYSGKIVMIPTVTPATGQWELGYEQGEDAFIDDVGELHWSGHRGCNGDVVEENVPVTIYTCIAP